MNLLDEAILFATKAHEGMTRKLGNTPYILHPLEVAAIANTMTNDFEILAAAVLHDVVEDAGISLETIEEQFGHRVYLLVKSETEDKRADQPASDTWQIRKEESLKDLKETRDEGVKILWLSDKLANLRSYARSYEEEGASFWNRFNQNDPAMQEWYYSRIADYTSSLAEYSAYQEYCSLLQSIFH